MSEEFESYLQNLHSYRLDFSKNADGVYKSREVAMFFAVWAQAYSFSKQESARQIREGLIG